jgi:hypothetical protein
LNVYPYKTIKAGKYTKYIVSITEKGSILVEYFFKNKRKSHSIFESQFDIKSSNLPKNIKEVACWASFESKILINYQNIKIDSPEGKWF